VEDITNLHRTKLIITQGKIYDPAKLYGAISIRPFE